MKIFLLAMRQDIQIWERALRAAQLLTLEQAIQLDHESEKLTTRRTTFERTVTTMAQNLPLRKDAAIFFEAARKLRARIEKQIAEISR